MINQLPIEIIDKILYITNIICHCCKKRLDFNFWKKQNKFYYCSEKCYKTF